MGFVMLMIFIDSLKELESLGITIYAEDVLKKLTKTHPLAKSTQHLSLKHCRQMQSIQISDFKNMVQLRELYVEACPDLTQLIADSDKPNLHALTLAKLPALETIQIGSSPHHFRNLLEITISHCQKLHYVTWVLKLESLEKLSICHCHELDQVVQETDDAWIEYTKDYQTMTRSRRINGIQHHVDFPKLRSLVLTDLPKLRRICIPRDFPCLESIMVEDCPNLSTIPLGQTYDCQKLNRICGSNDWWKRLEWGSKGIMKSEYFISIQDKD
jgi:disease resistance protein RPS2